MSTGGASKHPANDTQKEASPKIMKEKLYSGVVYESVDEDKQNKSRYHLWKQKYVGDHIRDPQPLPPSKKPKAGEVPSSSSLSTVLGYIISPVKYLASALTSSSEPEKPLEKPKNRHGYKFKDPSPRRLEASHRQTAAENTSHSPLNAADTSLKNLEAPVRALKTIPLSEITATTHSVKSRGGTPTTHPKDKKPADKKQKPGSTKKVHEIKKSQSQQIKGSPKVFKSYSPPRNLETLPVISNTRLVSASDLKIVQSNHTAFRVVSREDANANSDADALATKLELNPALASKSNNSNIACQLSPMMAPLNDELCFVDDMPEMLLAYSVQNCSNSVSNWNFPESAGSKYAFQSESGNFRNRSHGSLSLDLPRPSNVPALWDTISCDREAIETIFSGNLLTQCTPTQLLSGHKSRSKTSLAHESLHVDPVDLRETLLVNDNTHRLKPTHKKWQPLKDYEGDSGIIIVPTGPTRKKRSPFPSPKNSPSSSSSTFQKTSKTKPPVTSKRKASKQDSARNQSPSSSRTGQSRFLSRTSKSVLPARPASSPGLTLKRTTVTFHTVPKKTEEIKKEDIKQEEIKKEVKKEEVKKEEVKKEEVKKEEVKKEEIKKTSPVTPAVKTAAIAVAATAVPEAITKAATSEVLGAGRATFSNNEEKAINETAPHATVPATERSISTQNEESWLAHAIRSLSPKRKEPPHNFNSETEPQERTMPARQPSIPSSKPPATPAGANISPKFVTITSADAPTADPHTSSTQGGASMSASAMREALKFTSAVREAMKMSHSANFLGKKHLSSLISRAEYDQEKQDDYPKYFSVAATLHGEFP